MGSILPACLALLAAIWAALHALPKPAASLTRKPVCNPMVRCSQGRNRGRPRAGFFEAAAPRLVSAHLPLGFEMLPSDETRSDRC